MTELLGVDTNVVETAALDVADATVAMRNCLVNMQGTLTPLTYLWTGGASQAFVGARQVWEASLGDMIEVLGRLGGTVDAAATRYATAESDATSLWT